MACDHKRLRCTNGEFFCLDCGAKVKAPEPVKAEPEVKEPTKRKKKGESK